jgi:hypothetical protein
VRDAIRASLEWELAVDGRGREPVRYARQLVQTRPACARRASSFPTTRRPRPGGRAKTRAWARWPSPPAPPPALRRRSRLLRPPARYAQDQLDWILGRNPFDASLLEGAGHNNPEYGSSGSFEYTNAPGGIVNGITAGFDRSPGHRLQPAAHRDRRRQRLALGRAVAAARHWYLLALAAGEGPSRPADGRVIIGYVFAQDRVLDPAAIAADKLTHINYAFANIKDGRVVEGSRTTTRTSVCSPTPRAQPEPEDPRLRRGLDLVQGLLGRRPHQGEPREVRGERGRLRAPSRPRRLRRGLGIPGPARRRQREPAADKQNFSAAMAELRTALDKEGAARGRHLLLTFAAGASSISSSTRRWTWSRLPWTT